MILYMMRVMVIFLDKNIIARHDPLLIKVIADLGFKASGKGSWLMIRSIISDNPPEYHIRYDMFENREILIVRGMEPWTWIEMEDQ